MPKSNCATQNGIYVCCLWAFCFILIFFFGLIVSIFLLCCLLKKRERNMGEYRGGAILEELTWGNIKIYEKIIE